MSYIDSLAEQISRLEIEIAGNTVATKDVRVHLAALKSTVADQAVEIAALENLISKFSTITAENVAAPVVASTTVKRKLSPEAENVAPHAVSKPVKRVKRVPPPKPDAPAAAPLRRASTRTSSRRVSTKS
ncbi:hypothetical protein B0H11DRAFT_2204199 [Mycena galericulata]|nr:hypothetical protein B0H11DRAFT_2204199 [Mycena galericulata]